MKRAGGRSFVTKEARVCHEYEFDWYEQARIAEQQRREKERTKEKDGQPSRAPAGKPDGVKDKEPVPA